MGEGVRRSFVSAEEGPWKTGVSEDHKESSLKVSLQLSLDGFGRAASQFTEEEMPTLLCEIRADVKPVQVPCDRNPSLFVTKCDLLKEVSGFLEDRERLWLGGWHNAT